ncbi:MAG: hypothetical protein A2418_02375 [Candidatus Brennerbacteria bacterium RIFOXYC1_FULL_41_11]|uniref:DUF5652 domain-containing protein n=1 Tax=Candidatus Brennerbacteria bacterium RIFOXYD1_FULL_41_16 TaxID=1797529 RepID=A0A1G1XJC1_9BACT|nr:MAG: hypothetical protein A2391_02130 [Candidatus Brennerbacteria bacterium RIFOXYB1_FULL_41_13]OGY39030.1 MAG: hypothetical protein A2418_02375 [Candidatus Brennerbacteria bacterium RIFOXYC1_FULL_41_11]OGY40183.1 MAG: hypothetical protein A2570_02755 [Candidatus Brennerbacteria bacterium RIFOXYD1_FULL_41_16]
MFDQLPSLMANRWVILFLLSWSLVWKGLALWRAARSSQRNWFIVLLVVNTLGVLEIFYLFFWDSFKQISKKLFGSNNSS